MCEEVRMFKWLVSCGVLAIPTLCIPQCYIWPTISSPSRLQLMETSREDLEDYQLFFTSVSKCILRNGRIDVSSHDMNRYFYTFMAS